MGVRALIAVLLCFLTVVNAGDFESSVKARELGLADIPACGIECMLSTVPATGCSLDDINCVCSNAGLAHTLAACMLANCTMADTASTARVEADLCNLSRASKRTEFVLYTGIVFFLGSLCVALRTAGKLVSKRLALDDYMVAAAWLLSLVPFCCCIAMTRLGFGEHLWDLQDGALLPILRLFYVAECTYVVVLGLIKVSLILFYLEIFKTPRFTMTAYIILAYIITNTTVIFFMTIFTCMPIDAFWDRDIKTGKCLNQQGLAYANSASAILQDLILLILPLVFIRNLQMKKYKKAAVGFMLMIGTFGCIATIVRLQTLLAFKISIDPTWDYVPVTIWTLLELATGFACISLPSIRILVVKVVPVGVKEFLSNVTSLSSKGHSGPKQVTPPQSKEWKEPSNWYHLSADFDDSAGKSGARKSFMSSLWPRNSGLYSSSHTRSGTRRLESVGSNHSESGLAVTRPSYRESAETRNQPIELLPVPKSQANEFARHSCQNYVCSGGEITALPVVGCLPERSYSDPDLRKHLRGS